MLHKMPLDHNERTLFPQDSICSLDGTSQFELSNGAAINPVSGLYQQQAYFMTGSTAPLCPSSSSGLGSTNGDAPVVPVMSSGGSMTTFIQVPTNSVVLAGGASNPNYQSMPQQQQRY